MSLDWGIEKCRDWKELKSDTEWPITEAMIFECMSVGIGAITEKNWRTFYARSMIFRRLIGAEEFKPSDVRRRIGLHTNVSNESKTRWFERIWKEAEYRAKLRITDEDRENAEKNGLIAKPEEAGNG